MNRYILGCVFLTFATAAYAENAGRRPAEPKLQSVYDVLERIRQDVGYYEVQAAGWRGDLTPKTPDPALIMPASDDPPDETHRQGQPLPPRPVVAVCSIDKYDFDVSKVELSLHASTVDTKTGGVGLKIPYVGGGPDVTRDAGRSQQETIVLHRTVPYDIAILKQYAATEDYIKLARTHEDIKASGTREDNEEGLSGIFPISDALIALRKSLVRAAEKLPCFDQRTDEAVKDSITLEFQVQHSADNKIGFTLAVLSAKAGDKQEDGSGNKITVTFSPHSTLVDNPDGAQMANARK